MPQASWINIHRFYNNFTKPPEFIFGNSKLGSYSLNSNNLVTLAILIPNKQLELYTMTNLFTVGKQKVVQKIYTYKQNELVENLHSILKIAIEKDNVNVVGLDLHDNILEIEFNIVTYAYSDQSRKQHHLPKRRAEGWKHRILLHQPE